MLLLRVTLVNKLKWYKNIRTGFPLLLFLLLWKVTLMLRNPTVFSAQRNNTERQQQYFVIISAVYSAKSRRYADNQFVLLLIAPKSDLVGRTKLVAKTANGTDLLLTNFMVHQAAAQEDYCHWEAYMGTFESVSQPHSLQIGYREKLLVPVEIQRPYLKKRVQVGACFSPLFYVEHWQLVVLTIETYRHFGVTLQIVYLMSAFEGIFEILKDYNATDVISIEPWYSVDLVGMNYNGTVKNPNMEIVWRNQAAAHTDCLMKYGYAAEFLIVGDFDDILVPDHGTYYDEFIRIAVPTAAALVYNRFHVHITTTRNASYFSLFDTLMSAKVDVHIPLTPKYVANTARAESLWIHSPYIVQSNCIFQNVPVMEGRMFHLREWNFLEDNEAAGYNKSISEQSSDADAQNAVSLKFINVKTAQIISKNFEKSILKKGNNFFRKLPKQMQYSIQFMNCYKKVESALDVLNVTVCPGPHRCNIKPIIGLNCVNSKRKFNGHVLAPGIILYTAPTEEKFELSNNGCSF